VSFVYIALQRHIHYSELTDVREIADGGFGVVHRANHPEFGTVAYKELKSVAIPNNSRFDNCTLFA